MTSWRRLLPALFLLPMLAPAVSREMQELQRDVALLQQQVTTLQRSQDEKLGAIQALVQQALDATNKANTAMELMQNNLARSLRDQAAPVVNVGAKIDQMSGDVQAVRESVADLTSQMGKLQQQMIDISNAVKAMQAPAAPPPPATGTAPGPSAAGGVPPIPASTLYQNAMRDRSGGKYDIALHEFQDYLKYYGDTELAPDAEFYVGELLLKQNELDDALKEFDMVLEKYPDNSKTPDALYMKGATLVKMGKRTQGKQEFCELAKRFPSSDLAGRARLQVKTLGLTCGPSTAATSRTRKKS